MNNLSDSDKGCFGIILLIFLFGCTCLQFGNLGNSDTISSQIGFGIGLGLVFGGSFIKNEPYSSILTFFGPIITAFYGLMYMENISNHINSIKTVQNGSNLAIALVVFGLFLIARGFFVNSVNLGFGEGVFMMLIPSSFFTGPWLLTLSIWLPLAGSTYPIQHNIFISIGGALLGASIGIILSIIEIYAIDSYFKFRGSEETGSLAGCLSYPAFIANVLIGTVIGLYSVVI